MPREATEGGDVARVGRSEAATLAERMPRFVSLDDRISDEDARRLLGTSMAAPPRADGWVIRSLITSVARAAKDFRAQKLDLTARLATERAISERLAAATRSYAPPVGVRNDPYGYASGGGYGNPVGYGHAAAYPSDTRSHGTADPYARDPASRRERAPVATHTVDPYAPGSVQPTRSRSHDSRGEGPGPYDPAGKRSRRY